jgi:hypothetical protein
MPDAKIFTTPEPTSKALNDANTIHQRLTLSMAASPICITLQAAFDFKARLQALAARSVCFILRKRSGSLAGHRLFKHATAKYGEEAMLRNTNLHRMVGFPIA